MGASRATDARIAVQVLSGDGTDGGLRDFGQKEGARTCRNLEDGEETKITPQPRILQ